MAAAGSVLACRSWDARLLPRCTSVYGGGVVDLGQPGSRQVHGEVQKAHRRFCESREKQRGRGGLIAGNLHLLDGDLPETPGAPAMVSPRLPGGDDEQERGSGVESEWATGGGFQRELRVYKQKMWGWSTVHRVGNDWSLLAVVWGGIVR
jgi:hypothetical protein